MDNSSDRDNNRQVVSRPSSSARGCFVDLVCRNRNTILLVLVAVALYVLWNECDNSNSVELFTLNGGATKTLPRLNNLIQPTSSISDFRFSV